MPGREYYNSGGYAASGTISNDGGSLLQITGFNPTANAGFLLLFDVAAPPALTVPVQSIAVPALGNFSWCPTPPGRPFSPAMSWAVSSTGDEYTVSADAWWVYAELQGQ